MELKIVFDTTEYVGGMGRIVVDGRHFGLPVEVVRLFESWATRRAEAGLREALKEVTPVLERLEDAAMTDSITLNDWVRARRAIRTARAAIARHE